MPTIADVAKLAGVSAGTVSRVLNGAENVRPDTRARVEQAIANLDYVPNFQARTLRSKRTCAIALAIPELTNYYWTTVARGVQDATQAQGYQVFICNTRSPHHNQLKYLDMTLNRVDGIILTRRSERSLVASNQQELIEQSGSPLRIPTVYIDQSRAASWNIDTVYGDSISGSFALTEHLIGLGHRRIGIVSGRETSSSARDRVAGHCMALADAHIPIDASLICWGEYHRKSAERLTHDLIERRPDVTAIVAANNEIAIGVMYALEQRQLRVPEDIAVVCFNDFYPDSRFASTITCLDASAYDIGVNAVQLLFNRMDSDGYARPRSVALPTRMIVRQSCGGGQATPVDVDRRVDRVAGRLIPALPVEKIAALLPEIRPFVEIEFAPNDSQLNHAGQPDHHLRRVLQCESGETLTPHFEAAITNKRLYGYVLEREPVYETIHKRRCIAVEDQLELARRTGIAVVPCRFPWPPTIDGVAAGRDEEAFPDFPSLTDQIEFFDRCTRAARSSTVGVAADFGALVIGGASASSFEVDAEEALLEYQSKVAQLICDRFAGELTFVLVTVHIAGQQQSMEPSPELQAEIARRLGCLLRPAFDHALPTVVSMPGSLEWALPILHALGVNGVRPLDPERNDLVALKGAWNGKLSFVGGIPLSLLSGHDGREVERQVVDIAERLAQGGGYVLGVSGEIDENVPHQGILALLRAARGLTTSIVS